LRALVVFLFDGVVAAVVLGKKPLYVPLNKSSQGDLILGIAETNLKLLVVLSAVRGP
jgi:hypothetical protein